MTSGKRGPRKALLCGERKRSKAVHTSGQVGPKLQSGTCADAARSCRVWGGSPTSIFRILTAGQNLKNLQVWPHLPCLPFSGSPKMAQKNGGVIPPFLVFLILLCLLCFFLLAMDMLAQSVNL